MKITYTENKNGIYYPNLTLPTGTTYSIGKYGRLYLDYLKKHRRVKMRTESFVGRQKGTGVMSGSAKTRRKFYAT